MRSIKYFIVFAVICLFCSNVYAFNYETAWMKVNSLSEKQPRKALTELSVIENQAKSTNDKRQQLKSILCRMSIIDQFSDSALIKCIDEIQHFRQQENDSVFYSFSTFLLAKLVNKYSSQISTDNSNLSGVIPENMDEWSPNIFKDTVNSLLLESLRPIKLLQQHKATDYVDFFNVTKENKFYIKNLFDQMAYDCLSSIRDEKTRSQILCSLQDSYRFQDDSFPFVYASISSIIDKYTADVCYNRDSVLVSLRALLTKYKEEESSLLIRKELCFRLSHPNKTYTSKDVHEIESICNEGLAKFGKHPLASDLKKCKNRLKNKMLSMTLVRDCYNTSEPIRVKISYANVNEVDIHFYKYKITKNEQLFLEKKTDSEKYKTYKVKLKPSDYCILSDTVVEFPSMPYGSYYMESTTNKMTCSSSFSVSDLFYLESSSNAAKSANFVLIDSRYGNPRTDVDVLLYQNKKQIQQNKTNEDGFINLVAPGRGSYQVLMQAGKDKYKDPFPVYMYGKDRIINKESSEERISILTDRSIYKPGQTVNFKCISYTVGSEESHVNVDKNLTVELYDSNGTLIKKSEFKTNEFGSVASSFVLPQVCKLGNFYIKAGTSEKYIRVEEYKRPTYSITIEKPASSYSYGDTIRIPVNINYMTGLPVTNAKITYQVKPIPTLYWHTNEKEFESNNILSDSCESDENGICVIELICGKKGCVRLPYHRFMITVSVTDQNGESCENQTIINVGNQSMVYSFPVEQRLQIDSLKRIPFRVLNLNEIAVSKLISYRIQNKHGIDILKGTIQTDAEKESYLTVNEDSIPSGKYNFIFTGYDDRNREVVDTFTTILYRLSDASPIEKTPLWVEKISADKIEWGSTARFKVGTSFENAHILCIVESNQNQHIHKWLDLSNQIVDFDFEFKQEYGDILSFQFILVRDNELYQYSTEIQHLQKNKELPIKLEVFRENIEPSSDETWTLKFPSSKKAEVLLAMYDASLDMINSHSWNIDASLPVHRFYSTWSFSMKYYPNEMNFFDQRSSLINGVAYFGSLFANGMYFGVQLESEPVCFVSSQPLCEEKMNSNINERMMLDSHSTEDLTNVLLRSDFAETAFFYPQLQTDTTGEVKFSFKMPESLTKWNFMALAHTQDLHYGQMLQSVRTRKKFMITPNLPRFLRTEDQCLLTAKVQNLSDLEQSGIAIIQLQNPETGKVIEEKKVSFTVPTVGDTMVSWRVDVPEELDLVLVKVYAKTDSFSDGEQKLLPILSNRTTITQSMPITLRKSGNHTYEFEKLKNSKSKTLTNKSLKLEITTNPIWNVIQALPSISETDDNSIISSAAAYYASVLAGNIIKNHPEIEKTIVLWSRQAKNKETMLSNLKKNQEVKNILLSETPWVMEAKNETEQKQRLVTLLDLNNQKDKQQHLLSQIYECRNDDAAYSWYPEMSANRYVTTLVMNLFGRLKHLGESACSKQEAKRTLIYLDRQMKSDLDALKKYNPASYKKDAGINMLQLYYFYMRSYYPDIAVEFESLDAYRFYYKIIKEQWNEFSLYGKAIAALVLNRSGDAKEAKNVVNSLRQYATQSSNFGMYWEKNTASCLWYESAISTQTILLEAFQEIDPKKEELADMRVWLLQQKRSQSWQDPIATVDAVYAMLLDNSEIVQKNDISIKMGGKTVVAENKESGSEYFTKYFDGENVSKSLSNVEITKKGENLAWGALYWQYTENTNNVESSKNALEVQKMVMKESVIDKKKTLQPISNASLKVGDKVVVRLTIRSDRYLEFVALKDQRASCFEPQSSKSIYCNNGSLFYYQTVKDASMQYFFEYLQKGTYVIEYPLWVTHKGKYTDGIAIIQCQYAPEFVANSNSIELEVK